MFNLRSCSHNNTALLLPNFYMGVLGRRFCRRGLLEVSFNVLFDLNLALIYFQNGKEIPPPKYPSHLANPNCLYKNSCRGSFLPGLAK